jgi:hypothetical protein
MQIDSREWWLLIADPEEAGRQIAKCDALLAQHEGGRDLPARRAIAYALRGKVWWSLRAGLDDKAIAASELLLKRFAIETDPASVVEDADLLESAGHSLLFNRRFAQARQEHRSRWLAIALAWIYAAMGRPPLAVQRRPDGDDRRARDGERGADARRAGRSGAQPSESLRSVAQARRRRNEQAHRILAELTSSLADTTDPELLAVSAKAHINLIIASFATGRPLAVADDLRTLVSIGEPAIQALRERGETAEQRDGTDPHQVAAAALLAEATLLDELDRPDEAAQTTAELTHRFRDETSLGMRTIRRLARPRRPRRQQPWPASAIRSLRH